MITRDQEKLDYFCDKLKAGNKFVYFYVKKTKKIEMFSTVSMVRLAEAKILVFNKNNGGAVNASELVIPKEDEFGHYINPSYEARYV